MRVLRALLIFVGFWLLWTFVIALLARAAGKENMELTMQAALWISALQMLIQKIFSVARRSWLTSRQNETGLDPLVAAHFASRDALESALVADVFWPNAETISNDRSRFIALDEERELLRMAWRKSNGTEFHIEDTDLRSVLSAQVHQGDKPGFGSDFTNRIMVPAIMGAFSRDGVVVGALAADDLRYMTHVSLVLTVDDVTEPFREMNFLDTAVLVGSDAHREALETAQEWLARVNVMQRRLSREPVPSARSR